jgi:hypothetical protein
MPTTPGFVDEFFKVPTKNGALTFATVPALAPPVTEGWGRVPVVATVDPLSWETSVWWDSKSKQAALSVPARVRRGKGNCRLVEVGQKWRR